MSCSSLKKLVAAVSCIVACGMLLAAVPKPACAQKVEGGVRRTFAVAVNSLEQLPDFLSEQSLGMVVVPANLDTTPEIIQFADSGNCDESFDSTVWVHRPAMHITTHGAEIPGSVWWKLDPETPEPPPIGAITFSGPDSPLIGGQEGPYYYEAEGTGYRVRCSPGGAGLLVVVTAVFSR